MSKLAWDSATESYQHVCDTPEIYKLPLSIGFIRNHSEGDAWQCPECHVTQFVYRDGLDGRLHWAPHRAPHDQALWREISAPGEVAEGFKSLDLFLADLGQHGPGCDCRVHSNARAQRAGAA